MRRGRGHAPAVRALLQQPNLTSLFRGGDAFLPLAAAIINRVAEDRSIDSGMAYARALRTNGRQR